MNLFDKVKCKGFYKPFRDGKWLYFDKKTLTFNAMDNNLADGKNAGIVEKTLHVSKKHISNTLKKVSMVCLSDIKSYC